MMKKRTSKPALTLIDMLIAVVIISVLASIVLTTLTRIETKSKENSCRALLETLNTALRQFHDYGYEYRIDTSEVDEREFYRSLKFPPDCNGYDIPEIESEIEKLLDADNVIISFSDEHKEKDSGIAVMYFFLSRVPECRRTLEDIDESFLKSDHKNNEKYMSIEIDTGGSGRVYPWIRVVDPWGEPLRYDYYAEEKVSSKSFGYAKQTIRSFPLITSAGPDKEFDTEDDITNRERTRETTYQN